MFFCYISLSHHPIAPPGSNHQAAVVLQALQPTNLIKITYDKIKNYIFLQSTVGILHHLIIYTWSMYKWLRVHWFVDMFVTENPHRYILPCYPWLMWWSCRSSLSTFFLLLSGTQDTFKHCVIGSSYFASYLVLIYLFHLILGVNGSCPKVGSHPQMKRALLKRAALGFQPYRNPNLPFRFFFCPGPGAYQASLPTENSDHLLVKKDEGWENRHQ